MRPAFALPPAPPTAARERMPCARRAAACALAAAAAVATAAGAHPVLAADGLRGSAVFTANCAGCHAGGGNVIMYARGRTLFKKDLVRFGVDSPNAIYDLVRNGRGAMPKYGTTLSKAEIEDVSDFVFQMSESGWK